MPTKIYVIEKLTKKDRKSFDPPKFWYDLADPGPIKDSTDLARIVADDGAERFQHAAETDAAYFEENTEFGARVRTVELELK